jgi:hypothetical protein
LPAGFGKHLVHRPHSETALQRRIGFGMAERHLVERMHLTGRFDTLDAPTQTRKRVRAAAGHAPLLGGWAVTGFY